MITEGLGAQIGRIVVGTFIAGIAVFVGIGAIALPRFRLWRLLVLLFGGALLCAVCWQVIA